PEQPAVRRAVRGRFERRVLQEVRARIRDGHRDGGRRLRIAGDVDRASADRVGAGCVERVPVEAVRRPRARADAGSVDGDVDLAGKFGLVSQKAVVPVSALRVKVVKLTGAFDLYQAVIR